jgi:hypothetical protein
MFDRDRELDVTWSVLPDQEVETMVVLMGQSSNHSTGSRIRRLWEALADQPLP